MIAMQSDTSPTVNRLVPRNSKSQFYQQVALLLLEIIILPLLYGCMSFIQLDTTVTLVPYKAITFRKEEDKLCIDQFFTLKCKKGQTTIIGITTQISYRNSRSIEKEFTIKSYIRERETIPFTEISVLDSNPISAQFGFSDLFDANFIDKLVVGMYIYKIDVWTEKSSKPTTSLFQFMLDEKAIKGLKRYKKKKGKFKPIEIELYKI